MRWFLCDRGRKFGDVWTERHSQITSYASSVIRQMYTNAPHPVQPLAKGGTTLSIGFVDLSVVGFSNISPGVPANTNSSHMLHRFVLVDDTAAHVAASMVLWEMARGQCSARQLAQAWYSSVWDRGTEEAFRCAARALMQKPADDTMAALPFWKKWATCPSVTLEAAHAAWSKVHSFECCEIVQLAKKKDRLAFAHHYITGELFTAPSLQVAPGKRTRA
eukprot:UN1977